VSSAAATGTRPGSASTPTRAAPSEAPSASSAKLATCPAARRGVITRGHARPHAAHARTGAERGEHQHAVAPGRRRRHARAQDKHQGGFYLT
jgi:hypothetical protein